VARPGAGASLESSPPFGDEQSSLGNFEIQHVAHQPTVEIDAVY
jgi:hypothetical protein